VTVPESVADPEHRLSAQFVDRDYHHQFGAAGDNQYTQSIIMQNCAVKHPAHTGQLDA